MLMQGSAAARSSGQLTFEILKFGGKKTRKNYTNRAPAAQRYRFQVAAREAAGSREINTAKKRRKINQGLSAPQGMAPR